MKTLTQNSKGQYIVTENGIIINSLAVSVYDRLLLILSNAPNVQRMPLGAEPKGIAVFYGEIPYID